MRTQLRLRATAILSIFIAAVGLFSISMTNKTTNENREQVVIAFSESLPLVNELPSFIHWTLTNKESNAIVANGNGNTLFDYVFNIPGEYLISLTGGNPNADLDDEDYFPDVDVDLYVSPVKMTFDMNSLQLSKEIVGGEDMQGSTLTINAEVQIFDGKPVKMENKTFKSAGVGAEIHGELTNPELMLMPGNNVIQYNLYGTATKGNYIMFDLVDYNGGIQCYYFTTPVK